MRILQGLIIALLLSSSVFAAEFTLKSKNYADGDRIPVLYTCDGKNISPNLYWVNPPQGTQSFVILFTVPNVPSAALRNNWVIYNIPATMTQLDQGASDDLPRGVYAGMNSYDESDYRGPCPIDANTYSYVFTIYALDAVMDLPDHADIDLVRMRMKRHIIKQADLTGMYSH